MNHLSMEVTKHGIGIFNVSNFTFAIGCKGNGNRFSSVEDCVNTCGGSSDPVTHSHSDKCKHVQCDTAEANVSNDVPLK